MYLPEMHGPGVVESYLADNLTWRRLVTMSGKPQDFFIYICSHMRSTLSMACVLLQRATARLVEGTQ